jgi:tetratricopeptide (TPR) repeat protein
VREIADITVVMRGQSSAFREGIVIASQQMMKGVQPEKFVENALLEQLPGTVAKLAQGETTPTKVNTDTFGGVSGLTGVDSFDPVTLAKISPQLLVDGHEKLLDVFSEKRMKTDPSNPELDLIVEALDEMDGSMIVDLMNTLSIDQEWDQFLAGQVNQSLNNQDYEKASDLINRIRNPVAKINSLNEVMSTYLLDGKETETKLLMARVKLELDNLKEPDIKAKMLISIGESLGSMGSKSEPEASFLLVNSMATESVSQHDKASIHARLAVAYMQQGDKGKSRLQFFKATGAAGRIKEHGDRISAFTRIAMRYFDVRNTTLANEILAESEILAATLLEPVERGRIFGEIAIARGYLGDLVGANMAIDNAASGEGRQQLYARLAGMLIGLNRYYEALSIMDSIENDVENVRLEIRIISRFIHSNRQTDAKLRLPGAIRRARRVTELSDQGLFLSQLARLAGRLGDIEQSQSLFGEALTLSNQLQDRKTEVNSGLVALNQARIFQFRQSQNIMEGVHDIVIKDPVGNEILATRRTVTLLLPEFLPEVVED